MYQRTRSLGPKGSITRIPSGHIIANPPSTVFSKLLATGFGGFFLLAGLWVLSGAGGQTATWPFWATAIAGGAAVLLGGSMAYFTLVGGDQEVIVDERAREFIFTEVKNGAVTEKCRVGFDEVEYAYLASQQSHTSGVRASDIVYLNLKGRRKNPLIFSGAAPEADAVGQVLVQALSR